MAKIYAYGESLIRFDVDHQQQIKMYPTGTALNFLSNIAALKNHQSFLLSAFSTKKDAKLFTDFLKIKAIDYQNCFLSPHQSIGSYILFRPPSGYGQEVVYSRQASVWVDFLEQTSNFSLAKASKGDHLHFDGISLLTHKQGFNKVKELLLKAKAKQMTISFDFNLRYTLAKADVLTKYQQVLELVDYLNISIYDINYLLGLKIDDEVNFIKLVEQFPNLKAVFGYQKTVKDGQMEIWAFFIKDKKVQKSHVKTYVPRDLIGQGDAFSALMINDLINNKKPNLEQALEWSILKSYYLGDANVPTLQDFLLWKKQVPVIR